MDFVASAVHEGLQDLAAPLSFGSLATMVLVSFAAACLALLLFSNRAFSRNAADFSNSGFLSDGSVFLFSGKSLFAASEDANDLLETIEGSGTVYERLVGHLSAKDGQVAGLLDKLVTDGSAFVLGVDDPDGSSFEIEGRPRAGLAALYIRDTSRTRSELSEATEMLSHIADDRDNLSQLWRQAPLLAWRRQEDGTLLWANEQVTELALDGDKRKLPECFLDPGDGQNPESTRRVLMQDVDGEKVTENWFEVEEFRTPEGHYIGFASDLNDFMKVEFALKRFVGTLTETFAHLPTGLAIFDADRRLNMFNPALAELMRLDPAWLAGRPGMRDFMLRLREAQMMPEEKNSDAWRERVQEIEAKAVEGTLLDKWVLTSGQTLQVTGRPHPHGAVALLFEDISTHITMERKYQSEIELSQATLDNLSETVCVFDTAGKIVFCNSAFMEVWGFDPTEAVETPTIREVTSRFAEKCDPSPVWGDLRDFATSSLQRTSWTAEVEMKTGVTLLGSFAPLPDGSTLIVFNPLMSADQNELSQRQLLRDTRSSHNAEIAMMELAIEHMKEALSALSTSQNEPNVENAGKRDHVANTVQYAETLLKLRRSATHEKIKEHDALSEDLSELLESSDVTLSLSCEQLIAKGRLTSDVRRLLVNLVLVARSSAAPQSHIDVTVAEMSGGVSASCMFKDLDPEKTEFDTTTELSMRILDRFVSDHGGQIEVSRLKKDGSTKIACTLKTSESTSELRQKLEA